MTIGIYKIFNKITGKCYVGSAKNIARRWLKHKYLLRAGTHHSAKLQNSWNKHGEGAWDWCVIEECLETCLLEREQYYLDYFNTCQCGYNINPEAGRIPTWASIKGGKIAGKMSIDRFRDMSAESGRLGGIVQGKINADSGQMAAVGRKYGAIYGKIHGYIQGRKNVESGQLKGIAAKGALASNHKRWHVGRGVTSSHCQLCQEVQ